MPFGRQLAAIHIHSPSELKEKKLRKEPQLQPISLGCAMPFIRKLLVSIAPQALFPKHDNIALVLGFSAEGAVRYVLEDKEGEGYSNITSIEEVDNKLYFGSLKNRSVGVYDMKW